MNNRAALTKQWQRQWEEIKDEYLAGKLPAPIIGHVSATTTDGVRWECPECGAYGQPRASEALALANGRRHMLTHITPADEQVLEDMKVTMMPEELLTPYQHSRRNFLTT